MNTLALVVDAFAQLGIDAQLVAGTHDPRVDVLLDPAGVHVLLDVKHRSLVSDEVAQRLLVERSGPDDVLLVVGDRISAAARRLLTSPGSGYYDLRGRLALRADRLLIDADVEPITKRAERTNALSGKAGLEVATALLMRPGHAMSVRELARRLGRSVSTVSEVLAALRRDDLIDSANVVEGADLFWAVASRWDTRRTLLAQLPLPGDVVSAQPLRLGLDDAEHRSGWALTDSAAAVAYGAPLAFRSDQVLNFFVPDQSVVRRATTLLGAAGSTSQARATLRVAPVPVAVQQRVELTENPLEWPLAHPLFVALDLAQDIGRGSEILEAWTPDDRWVRVW